MSLSVNVHPRSKVAGADLSAAQYRFVQLNGSGQIILVSALGSLGEEAYGVLQDEPIADDVGAVAAVYDGGKSKVVMAETVAAGDPLTSDAAGAAIIADTATHKILGYADKAATVGSIGEINLELNGVV